MTIITTIKLRRTTIKVSQNKKSAFVKLSDEGVEAEKEIENATIDMNTPILTSPKFSKLISLINNKLKDIRPIKGPYSPQLIAFITSMLDKNPQTRPNIHTLYKKLKERK